MGRGIARSKRLTVSLVAVPGEDRQRDNSHVRAKDRVHDSTRYLFRRRAAASIAITLQQSVQSPQCRLMEEVTRAFLQISGCSLQEGATRSFHLITSEARTTPPGHAGGVVVGHVR
ncbi:hypothetical protein Q3C01_11985 [Bradyrhizobium sp. UFLA05-109]